MQIVFTQHARDKFNVLARHQFTVTEDQVLETIRNPDLIDRRRLPLLIAQRGMTHRHVLRVVYKQEDRNTVKVITFYPGRRSDYE
jgi:hypothetical protein